MKTDPHINKSHRQNRRKLRKHMTKAEVILWARLKNKQLKGRRFRRQHSIGGYITDFYCFSEKLIIEVDGPYHDNPSVREKDEKKELFYYNNGFKIIRIRNHDVLFHLEKVLEDICEKFEDDGSL